MEPVRVSPTHSVEDNDGKELDILTEEEQKALEEKEALAKAKLAALDRYVETLYQS